MTNLQQASQLVSDILGLKYDKFFYGDTVATSDQYELMVLDDKENPPSIICLNELLNNVEEYNNIDDLILIQRNISLSMVLDAIRIFNPSGTKIDNYERYDAQNKTVDMWQLRKNGKDCNLSDQSEEFCKLIVEVLK